MAFRLFSPMNFSSAADGSGSRDRRLCGEGPCAEWDLAPCATQIASGGSECFVDGFVGCLAGVTDHDLATMADLGGKLATDAMAMEWIEFFLDGRPGVDLFTREARSELFGLVLDVTAYFRVQGEGIPANRYWHT
jgi:hypothetical protein